MNNKAQYELTITEKLDQLSVPDAVDAIWARIEATLDLEMPTNDGPSDPPAGSPAGPGFWFGAIFLAALISVIYFVNNRSSAQRENENFLRETPAVIQPAGTNDAKPPPVQSVNQNSTGSPVRTADTAASLPVSPGATVEPGIDVLSSNPDSINVAPAIPAPVITNPAPDTIPKKTRGVKGIKDGDYRIEPVKKDAG